MSPEPISDFSYGRAVGELPDDAVVVRAEPEGGDFVIEWIDAEGVQHQAALTLWQSDKHRQTVTHG